MNGKFRWLYPALWGILMLAAVRIIGDVHSKQLFWTRPVDITLSEILFTVSMGYLMDYFFRKGLKANLNAEMEGKPVSKFREYLILELNLILGPIVGVFLLHEYAHYEHDWQGYAMTSMLVALCGTSMYAAIRNTMVDERAKKQEMLLAQMKSENLDTQLQLLKSQYHPHFLFNALNTIYFQVNEDNKDARQTIQTLSNLLRYQLYTIDEKVDIEQEIAYITSYIDLMKKRKSERLELNTQFDETMVGRKIYPLLFQPLIENAFKYVGGENPYIAISLTKAGDGACFYVRNSIPEVENADKKGGIGIENLQKRLDLLYSKQYQLQINKETKAYTVQLTLKTI